MKFISLLIGLVILITGFVLVGSRKPTDSKETRKQLEPLQVVEIYCEFAVKGDYEKIKNYTSGVPKEYFDARKKTYQKSNNTTSTTSKDSEDKILFSESSNELDSFFLPSINEVLPKSLNEYDIFINEVKNVSIKEKEARVEVELRSKRVETYRSQQHFLLYRVNNEWRVFMIVYPPTFDKYGISD